MTTSSPGNSNIPTLIYIYLGLVVPYKISRYRAIFCKGLLPSCFTHETCDKAVGDGRAMMDEFFMISFFFTFCKKQLSLQCVAQGLYMVYMIRHLYFVFAMAVLAVVNISCSGDDEESRGVVTIDDNGNAIGEHRFTQIDATNFYVDDIRYTVVEGNLHVTGYDREHLTGAASIITTLKYKGWVKNVTIIGEDAFRGCEALTSIGIPQSVTEIKAGAFSGCVALTSVSIPNSVKSLRRDAFYGCSGLTSVTIGNSVISIGGWAFFGCTSLTSITIPKSVTTLGVDVFNGCTGLTSVTIPESVNSIESSVFSGCTSLTSVVIPRSVKSLGVDVFSGCTKLAEVYCYAPTPPKAYSAFDELDMSSLVLYVPAESIDDYRANYPWAGFGSIVATGK